jgi:polyphosphate kinase
MWPRCRSFRHTSGSDRTSRSFESTISCRSRTRIKRAIRDDSLFLHLRDNTQAWCLGPQGSYEPLEPGPDESPIDSQLELLERPGSWHFDD